MTYARDSSCDACRRLTSGDCGRHGPLTIPVATFTQPATRPESSRDTEIERRVLSEVARQHAGHFVRLDADLSLICHVDGSVLIGDLSALRSQPASEPTLDPTKLGEAINDALIEMYDQSDVWPHDIERLGRLVAARLSQPADNEAAE
jgi:hypothetical protein